MSSTYNRIEPLTKENYETWCMHAQAMLIKSGLWEYANGDAVLDPAAHKKVKTDFIQNDIMARSKLFRLISPSKLEQVKNCKTSKEVWNKLREAFQDSARKATTKQLIRQRLLKKMQDSNKEILNHQKPKAKQLVLNSCLSLPTNDISEDQCCLESGSTSCISRQQHKLMEIKKEDGTLDLGSNRHAEVKGAPTPKGPKFGNSMRKVIKLEIEIPESVFSTAAITNPEEKSDEDMRLNTNKNERPTHKVKLESNKGSEHIAETNQFDSIISTASTNSLDYHPAATECDSRTSCKIETQPSRSSNNRILTCNICEYTTSRRQSLNSHLKAHVATTRYSCDSSLFITTDSRSLKRNMKLHTDEKPYFCNVCDKKFSDKSSVGRHLRLHTAEKHYFCNICDKKFSQKANVELHLRLHTGEKPYSCNICDQKFSQKSNLVVHVRLHTGEKPYNCNVCHKKFSHKGNLNKHVIRLHTGEKPYYCNVCDKKFSDKSSFVKHVREHTGEKPYYVMKVHM